MYIWRRLEMGFMPGITQFVMPAEHLHSGWMAHFIFLANGLCPINLLWSFCETVSDDFGPHSVAIPVSHLFHCISTYPMLTHHKMILTDHVCYKEFIFITEYGTSYRLSGSDIISHQWSDVISLYKPNMTSHCYYMVIFFESVVIFDSYLAIFWQRPNLLL